jgi:ABC-type phosphate transport system permease subunit
MRLPAGSAKVFRDEGSIQYDTLFAVGLLLFMITLVINFISIRLVRRYREAY